jgi:hypothetical protein
LSHQAAQILKRLNHPRGMRALSEHPGERLASSRGLRREQLYEDLNRRSTDELVALWHQNDRSRLSEPAFEVMETILTERLGKLPARGADAPRRSPDDIDESVNPRIQALWRTGNTDGLMRFFESETDDARQLEAAEALADLGDEEALDVLIEALDDPDERIGETAAVMLDWLDLPRGNVALQEHGFKFETGAEDLFGRPEQAQPPEEQSPPTPSPTQDSWAAPPQAYRPAPGFPAPASTPHTAWQPDAGSGTSPAIFLTGAIGGLLGFILFRLGLHFLALLPLPDDPAGWLQASNIGYLAAAIIVGASLGALGSRVARALAARFGQEPGEGDMAPVIGALIEGTTSALLADVLLFSIFGS